MDKLDSALPRYTLKFSESPREIIEWKEGDMVTRQNFSDLLIKSFIVASGYPAKQEVFFLWLNSKTGMDYGDTIRNFLNAGGWNTLSEEERGLISENFFKVGKEHRRKIETFKIDPATNFASQLSTLTEDPLPATLRIAEEISSKYGGLAKMSLADLKKEIRKK